MKKLLILLLCTICALSLVCCSKDEPDDSAHVTPSATMVTFSFVVEEPYSYVAPDPIQLEAGKAGGELAFPEGAVPLDMHDDLHWYYDQGWTKVYLPTDIVEGDTTLYLGESGKTYTITYQIDETLTYEGEFVSQFAYDRERVLLPKVVADGYPTGWYCVENEATWVAIPAFTDHNVTLRSPVPIQYGVYYQSGVENGDDSLFVNPNRAYCTVKEPVVALQAPSYTHEGQPLQFDHWELRFSSGARTRTIGGVTYTDGQELTEVTYQMATSFAPGEFYIVATWQN